MEYVHIIDHLRDELEKEVDTLYEDISFLQVNNKTRKKMVENS
jgi:hypothetical protein